MMARGDTLGSVPADTAGCLPVARQAPRPPRTAFRVAGGPFIFGGHRLASLYRAPSQTDNPFSFVKIRMARGWPMSGRVYLGKAEWGRASG